MLNIFFCALYKPVFLKNKWPKCGQDSRWWPLATNRNRSAVKTTPTKPGGVWDMQRWGEWREEEEEGKGILGCTHSPPSSPLPSSVRKTPSGFEWKPDLSSWFCMLCWDVPASLSSSLYSPFISKHKYYLPPCLYLSLPSRHFFFLTLTRSFCFFLPHCQCFCLSVPTLHPPPPPWGP